MKKTKKVSPLSPREMTGAELWAKLQALGFSQVGFARTIGVGDRSVRAWIAGRYLVPTPIAMLVNLMLKTKTTAKDLQA